MPMPYERASASAHAAHHKRTFAPHAPNANDNRPLLLPRVRSPRHRASNKQSLQMRRELDAERIEDLKEVMKVIEKKLKVEVLKRVEMNKALQKVRREEGGVVGREVVVRAAFEGKRDGPRKRGHRDERLRMRGAC